jgi:hypothetical protein
VAERTGTERDEAERTGGELEDVILQLDPA